MKLRSSRFTSVYLLGLISLSASAALRGALLIRCWGEADTSVVALARTFGVGLLMDAMGFACCALPLVLGLVAIPGRLLARRGVRWINLAIYTLGVLLIAYGVATEWFFWDEFSSRFNFIAVDYLVYTQEVLGNIWQSYPVLPVSALLLAATAAIVALTARAVLRSYHAPSTWLCRVGTLGVFAAVAAASPWAMASPLARSSTNEYNSQLADNGVLCLVTAFFENEIDYDRFYVTDDDEAVFARLRELLAGPGCRFLSDDPHDIRRAVTCDSAPARRNVVLVVVESLSADYLGAFGNAQGWTPNLDALAAEGLVLRRMYATGTRTVRGLEGIALSLPPTPGGSVIKRPHLGEGLFSIGTVFREQGYRTAFIYGGRGRFDNMNAFFGANGFDVIDRSDIEPDGATFTNAWGVCDGDLYRRVLAESDRAFAQGEPFFWLVMTTSNHRPFSYPQVIDIPSGTGRAGAVKYTDYAIGQFIEQARGRPWFDQTIFIFVADHCANSAGKVAVPPPHYHIPAIFYAPGFIRPGPVDTLCCQMDLAPTLLGLMNISYTSRFFGKDVLRDPPDRALLGTYQRLGLMAGNKLVLLGPRQQVQTYTCRDDGAVDLPIPTGPALLRDAVTYYQSASRLLQDDKHPPQ